VIHSVYSEAADNSLPVFKRERKDQFLIANFASFADFHMIEALLAEWEPVMIKICLIQKGNQIEQRYFYTVNCESECDKTFAFLLLVPHLDIILLVFFDQ
jgi:hypothetical protein